MLVPNCSFAIPAVVAPNVRSRHTSRFRQLLCSSREAIGSVGPEIRRSVHRNRLGSSFFGKATSPGLRYCRTLSLDQKRTLFPSRILRIVSETQKDDTEKSSIATAAASLDEMISKMAVSAEKEMGEEDGLEDIVMTPLEHLEEFRQRTIKSMVATTIAVSVVFLNITPIVKQLEALAPASTRFLQLAPGEYLFSTLKLSAYGGFLLASPYILYEIIEYIAPALKRSEKQVLFPLLIGSAVLFVLGILFSYSVLTPAAINFFVSYAGDVVEDMWSFDKYLDFVGQLFVGTGLASQIPIVQVLLGTLGIVSSQQMLSSWRYVIVAAMVAAAVLTPSTDPVTQSLLAGPLIALYLVGIGAVKLTGR